MLNNDLSYKLSSIATNGSDDSFSLITSSFNFSTFENFDTHANINNHSIDVENPNLLRNQIKQECGCSPSNNDKNQTSLENNYQSLFKTPVINQDKQGLYSINSDPKTINNPLLCSKNFNDENEEDFVNWDNLL